MSRAFVKEPDGESADNELPERPRSSEPNYVTPRGLRKLHEEQQRLREHRDRLLAANEDMASKSELRQVERDLRYMEASIQSAIAIHAAGQPHEDIRFGASVEVADEDGQTHRFTIVGEQETCAATGFISWVSPLARSLIGRRVGDTVVWHRPAGDVELEILAVTYPDLS